MNPNVIVHELEEGNYDELAALHNPMRPDDSFSGPELFETRLADRGGR